MRGVCPEKMCHRGTGSPMLSKVAFIAIYGTSYGMILFTISVGLAVTMGVMRVVNLAHGAFAATGAYLAVGFINSNSVPMPLAIVMAIAAVVVISIPVERYLYRPIYFRSELDQVVLTVGVVFIRIATLTVIYGTEFQAVFRAGWRRTSTYRLLKSRPTGWL